MTINLLQAKNILDDHLGSCVPHKKSGEISYNCPFCSHYKPKLQVNIITQKWRCWVCDTKGQSLDILLKKSNASHHHIQKIKEIYGESNFKIKSSSRELVSLPEHYLPLYVPKNTPDYRNAWHYVSKVRGIKPIDILRYQIGYCEEGPYAGMIIIPSYDENNQLNFYVGRSFYDTTISHKNPPVSKDIIGFENQINWNEPIILVEGSFDAIATRRNVIPLFGKIIQPKLKSKIIANTKKLYIALDRDALKNTLSYIEYFMNHDIEVYLVNLTGKDPSELGYEPMCKAISNAEKMDFFKLMVYKLEF